MRIPLNLRMCLRKVLAKRFRQTHNFIYSLLHLNQHRFTHGYDAVDDDDDEDDVGRISTKTKYFTKLTPPYN